jgi:rfaE bifunctional protein kinase chain/domain
MVDLRPATRVVEGFRDVRALVIGDVMLDEQIVGTAHRLSPEAPIPIVNVTRREWRPGGAANVATNMAAMGAAVSLIGVGGSDASADRLRERLRSAGVDNRLIVDERRPTTRKSRIYAPQQIVRLDVEEKHPIDAEITSALLAEADAILPALDVVVLSDYGKGVLTAEVCGAIITRALRARCRVLVDPKGRDFTKYAGADLITPNAREACAAVNSDDVTGDALSVVGRRLLKLVKCGGVLITRGADGMTLFQPGREPLSMPARARTVFDVTGAGDTVIAVMSLCLATNCEYELAMALANHAASLTVTCLGVRAVTAVELECLCASGDALVQEPLSQMGVPSASVLLASH